MDELWVVEKLNEDIWWPVEMKAGEAPAKNYAHRCELFNGNKYRVRRFIPAPEESQQTENDQRGLDE